MKERKQPQDPTVKDEPGTQPKKYYKGLSKDDKEARAKHFKKGGTGPAPGDIDDDGERVKTKPSKHTLKFRKMFGESNPDKSLADKSKKSGIPVGILKQVFKRGVKAWQTGHRPGTTAVQWGHARVNSFITKGKGTWGKADKDLADKVRGKTNEDKEEQDRDVSKNKGTQPKKYYKGLDKETKQKRDAHFKQGKTGPAPGDEDEDGKPTKTKKSVHTKKFAKMYGEKLDANADAGDYIKDFRKSDAPQFKGKSDKKIRKMAIAAYLDKKGK